MANANAIPMVPEATVQERWKTVTQYIVVSALAVLFLYFTFIMFANGEMLYAGLTLVFTMLFAYVFLATRAYVWRYVFPTLTGVAIFMIFPIMFTLGLTFTNKSNVHLLSHAQAESFFLRQTYIADGALSYDFTLYEANDGYIMVLQDEAGNTYQVQETLPLSTTQPLTEPMTVSAETVLALPDLPQAPRQAAIGFRLSLDQVSIEMPYGNALVRSRLTAFSERYSLWNKQEDGSLLNHRTGEVINANFETGFFETTDGRNVTPGFQINVGFKNYVRILTDKGFLAPFLSVFSWTMFFAIFSVVVTFFMGLTLASFVQWEPIKGRGIYQLLLILPYSVPAFILILIFKALFNQNFGQINVVLEGLFGVKMAWDSTIFGAKLKILLVNMYLGYPYMFILALGFLQSIPKDLYEASSLEGASPTVNFFKITLPMIIRPMLPLLIASFAFNFNNFVLIHLLTRGEPIIVGSDPQAGGTDLLVNYAYRLSFLGQSQDFALSATISTFIFIMIGIIAVFYLKALKIESGKPA